MTVNNTWSNMWAQDAVNLLSDRNIKAKTIDYDGQERDSRECNPDVLRSTLRKVPETASLLQKSRLPFALIIHPFRDDEVIYSS